MFRIFSVNDPYKADIEKTRKGIYADTAYSPFLMCEEATEASGELHLFKITIILKKSVQIDEYNSMGLSFARQLLRSKIAASPP